MKFENNKSFNTLGLNNISNGKSSSLPANISTINTHLVNGFQNAKLPDGPTNSKPGPILFIVATIDVNVVVKS